ncbi:hypothetical protein B0H17DRAFT_1217075 [Mycena rosella]|uniref:Uncharacterized protein n=1 Tax=Mycena rosella TaxID=1033263 RepID=A0AAD7C2P5_MYCRO|nr:hypothetical protein B0H17DRAFT_1217075 [Mycena rosella]
MSGMWHDNVLTSRGAGLNGFKHRTFLVKLAIGLGIPFAQIPHRHRYDVENVPTYPLVYRGPNIIGLISATCCIYILCVYASLALTHHPTLVLRTLLFRAPGETRTRTSIGWSRSRHVVSALASFALYSSAAEAQKHYRIMLWPVASRCKMKQPADSARAVEEGVHGADAPRLPFAHAQRHALICYAAV